MTTARDDQGRFLTGSSGGPGRKEGSRNKLGEAFLAALHEDFQVHGKATIARVREEKPDQYLKVVAMLLPKHVNVTTNPLDDLSDDELVQILDVLRNGLNHDAEETGTLN